MNINRTNFIIIILTIWLILPTFIQVIYSAEEPLSERYLIVVPHLCLLILIILFYFHYRLLAPQIFNHIFIYFKGPLKILPLYLLASFISISISNVVSYDDIILGYGYILAYIITFAISYLIYWPIFLLNTTKLKKLANLPLIDPYHICKASYYAVIVIILGYYLNLYRSYLQLGIIFSGRNEYLLKASGIGLLALISIIFPIVFGFTFIRFIIYCLSFIILSLTYSRTAIIAVIVASAAIILIKYKRRYRLFIILFILFIIIFIIEYNNIIFFIDRILLLTDRYRGIDKLSGRLPIWERSWEIFKGSPLFGVGFRLSGQLLGLSAHNGYLMSLVETGIIGTTLLFIYFIWIIVNLSRYYYKTLDNVSLYYLAIIIGITVFGMGERYLLNIGNVTSIMVFFAMNHSNKYYYTK